MKKVIVIQTATEHPNADYILYTCSSCKEAKNKPCFALVVSTNSRPPFGCIYAELDQATHDVSPEWALCSGNFQIING